MKKTTFIVLLSAIMILSMISGLVVPVLASGPGEHSWNLDTRDGDDGSVPLPLLQMEMTGGPGDNGQGNYPPAAPVNSILLLSGASQIWIADQAATADVVFSAVPTAWAVELVTDKDWQIIDGSISTPPTCSIEIGEWDGSVFWPFLSDVWGITYYKPVDPRTDPPHPTTSDKFILTYVFQLSNETVYKDCYLALRVTNDESMDHQIFCAEGDKSSCLTSTGGDFGYPTPKPPLVPVSSGVGTGLMIGSFALLLVVVSRARHNRHERI